MPNIIYMKTIIENSHQMPFLCCARENCVSDSSYIKCSRKQTIQWKDEANEKKRMNELIQKQCQFIMPMHFIF